MKKFLVAIVIIIVFSILLALNWTTISISSSLSDFESGSADGLAASDRLIEIGEPAVPEVAKKLKESNPGNVIFNLSVRTLIGIGSVDAMKNVLGVASNEDAKQFVAKRLDEIGNEKTWASLLSICSSEGSLGAIIIDIVGRTKDGNPQFLKDVAVKGENGVRANAILLLGEKQIVAPEVYESAIQSDSPNIRETVVSALKNIESEKALQSMLKMIDDQEPRVASTAIRAIMERKDRVKAVGKLSDNLYKGVNPVTDAVITALADMGANEILTDQLPKIFKDANKNLQSHIVHTLAKIGDSSSASFLFEQLLNEDSKIKDAAKDAILGLDEKAAPAALSFLLKNAAAPKSVKVIAIDFIGESKYNEAVETLGRLSMEDQSKSVQKASMLALSKIGGKKSIEFLSGIAKLNIKLSSEARFCLVQMGEDAIPELFDILELKGTPEANAAFKALKKMGKQINPQLMKRYGDKEYKNRAQIIYLIGELKDPANMEMLFEAMYEKEDKVSEAAIESLVKLGDIAVPGAIKALRHEEEGIRISAALLLNKLYPKGYYQQLIDALADKNPIVADLCSDTLVKLGKLAINSLLQNATNDDTKVSRRIAKIITMIGTQDTKDLESMLRSQNPMARRTAVETLARTNKVKFVPQIVALLKDEDIKVNKMVKTALEFFDKEAINPLDEFMKTEKENKYRRRAIDVLITLDSEDKYFVLMKYLNDEDQQIRMKALRGLKVSGLEGAVDSVKKCLRDDDQDVRQRAVEVLGTIATSSALELVVETLDRDDPLMRAKAVSMLRTKDDPKYAEYIAKMLNDDDGYVRSVAVNSLIATGDKKHFDNIIDLAEDKDSRVRSQVALAIGEIGREQDLPLMFILLNDENNDVATDAAISIGKLGSRKAIPELINVITASRESNIAKAGNCVLAVQKITGVSFADLTTQADSKTVKKAIEECIEWWEKKNAK